MNAIKRLPAAAVIVGSLLLATACGTAAEAANDAFAAVVNVRAAEPTGIVQAGTRPRADVTSAGIQMDKWR